MGSPASPMASSVSPVSKSLSPRPLSPPTIIPYSFDSTAHLPRLRPLTARDDGSTPWWTPDGLYPHNAAAAASSSSPSAAHSMPATPREGTPVAGKRRPRLAITMSSNKARVDRALSGAPCAAPEPSWALALAGEVAPSMLSMAGGGWSSRRPTTPRADLIAEEASSSSKLLTHGQRSSRGSSPTWPPQHALSRDRAAHIFEAHKKAIATPTTQPGRAPSWHARRYAGNVPRLPEERERARRVAKEIAAAASR